MKKISTGLVTGLTGVSLFLSATPTFAMSVMIDADGNARMEDAENAMMKKANKMMKTERADGKADVQTTATVEQKEELLTRMRQRMLAVIKRAVNHVAHFAKRFCSETTNTDGARIDCMADAKAKFKVEVDAIIDASFGSPPLEHFIQQDRS